MNITVVGPGALGCLFASMLAGTENTICLLDHEVKRAAFICENGLFFRADTSEKQVPVLCTSDLRKISQTDVLLLCVKSQDVESALDRLKPFFADNSDTLLIALQNGIAHHDVLCRKVAFHAVGITAQGGTLTGIGKVVHGGSGKTVLGILPGSPLSKVSLLKKVAKVFNDAGIQTTISETILGPIWDKLIINVGINALTAINDCCNGELLNDSAVVIEQKEAVEEAAQVAMAQNILLSGDPVKNTINVCKATRKNVSSMLQDVRKGRCTEIDAINGAIVLAGKRFGVPTPVNTKLVKMVKALEVVKKKNLIKETQCQRIFLPQNLFRKVILIK